MTRKDVISPVDVAARAALDVRTGDTVRVWQKIDEGNGKSRLQAFEGLVLARKHGTDPGATITVRKVVGGVGVERIFPLYSPVIDRIETVKRSRVRRAKLYFIREKVTREARRQLRRTRNVVAQTTETPVEAEAEEVPAAEAKAE
jgi:large subunit ribosomal protein L19